MKIKNHLKKGKTLNLLEENVEYDDFGLRRISYAENHKGKHCYVQLY